MDTPISRAEHEEFCRRMEDTHRRQDKRLELLEESVREISDLTTAVAKLAQNVESMVKEQSKQGERLETLERQDGEMWRKVVGYAVTAIVGVIIGYLFRQIGIG